jgi:hypothetical protein
VGESLETPGFRVVSEAFPGKTRFSCLSGREVSGLGLGKMIERVLIWRSSGGLVHCVRNLRKYLSICTRYVKTETARPILVRHRKEGV